MKDRIGRLKVGRGQAGFTLIELLVVITILGILAAIVVFSVGGINDKGQASACKTDTTTLQTAEEANFAVSRAASAGPPAVPAGGQYIAEVDLKNAGLLNDVSSLHDINVTGSGPTSTFQVVTQTTGPDANKCNGLG